MQSVTAKKMKKFSLILGIALSLSPTAMAGNATSAADIIGRLAADKQTATVGAADRSPVLDALALLPADVETYVSLANFSQSVRDVMALGSQSPETLGFEEGGVQQAILNGIRDITIATGKGTTAYLKPFQDILAYATTDSNGERHVNWQELGAQMPPSGKGLGVVIAATLDHDLMSLWKQNEQQLQLLLAMSSSGTPGIAVWNGTVADIPFWGAKINIADVVAGNMKDGASQEDLAEMAEFKKVWKDREVCIATATKDNQLIFIIAEDPEQQSLLAKSASDSVLSSKDADLLKSRMKNDIRFVYHFNADAVVPGSKRQGQYMSVFSEELKKNAKCQWAALITKLVDIASRQTASIEPSESVNMVAWKDHGVRISFSTGMAFADGTNAPLTLLDSSAMDKNVFWYTEGALKPQASQMLVELTGCLLSELPELCQDASFWEEVMCFSEESAQKEADFCKAHGKELKQLCGDIQSLITDMGNRRASIASVTGGNSPELQWSLFSDCADIAKAEADWKKVCASLGKLDVTPNVKSALFTGNAMVIGCPDPKNAKSAVAFSAGKAPLKGSAVVFRPTLLKNLIGAIPTCNDEAFAAIMQGLDGVLEGIYAYSSDDGKLIRGEVYVKAK